MTETTTMPHVNTPRETRQWLEQLWAECMEQWASEVAKLTKAMQASNREDQK